jgi:hypothetical protein
MIQLIDKQGFPILFKFGKHTYHFWSWRVITIARKATYQVAVKQGQLGWYTADGWLSAKQLKSVL